MTALTAKAALVDPATLEDGDGVIATRVPRSEIEEALETGTTSELFLDVARERDGERDAEHRITVSWEPAELEQLLSTTTGDDVTFAFKADELARMLDEPDVEAQGLRERMAILTVAATTAAGIGAGVAGAMPANLVGESGGGGGTTAAFVTDTTSSGPAAEAATAAGGAGVSHGGAAADSGTVSNFVTDTTSSAAPGEGMTPAQQLNEIEATGDTGSVSNLVTDATSSGPQASTEAGTVSNLVTDTTSNAGPGVNEEMTPAQQLNAIEATGDTGSVSNLVTDATSSGPAADPGAGGAFLTDATSSGPQASTEAASASGGGGQSFIESQGGKAALAGGLVLLILGAGFVGSRQRRGAQPA
jgi:hypothetical protein